MAITYNLISSLSASGGTVANFTFNSIPQNYTSLVLLISSRDDRGGQPNDDIGIRVGFNGTINSSGIYTQRRLYGSGSFTGSDATNNAGAIGVGMSTSSTATGNVFSVNEIWLTNYNTSQNKLISVQGISSNNGAAAWQVINSGIAATSNAVTDILLYPFDGTVFLQYTSARLYGIKNA